MGYQPCNILALCTFEDGLRGQVVSSFAQFFLHDFRVSKKQSKGFSLILILLSSSVKTFSQHWRELQVAFSFKNCSMNSVHSWVVKVLSLMAVNKAVSERPLSHWYQVLKGHKYLESLSLSVKVFSKCVVEVSRTNIISAHLPLPLSIYLSCHVFLPSWSHVPRIALWRCSLNVFVCYHCKNIESWLWTLIFL